MFKVDAHSAYFDEIAGKASALPNLEFMNFVVMYSIMK
jgi:hypothetical protein